MPTRSLLSISEPAPQAAARFLLENHSANDLGVLDLSRLLVVVPTQNSGRRLRECLAWLVSGNAEGSGLLPPRVLTPPGLVAAGSDRYPVAGDLESLLAWMAVLERIDLTRFPSLFPVPPANKDAHWRQSFAEALVETRRTLGEAGLLFSDVAQRDGLPERDRWKALAALESAYFAALQDAGLADREKVHRDLAGSTDLEFEVDNIYLMATPDPVPLALERLKLLAESLPVEVLIYGEKSWDLDAFDEWGRPNVDPWCHRSIPFHDFKDQVLVERRPADQVKRVVDLVNSSSSSLNSVTVGALDANWVRLLEGSLRRSGVPTYNPEGRAMAEHPLLTLVSCLTVLIRDRNVSGAAELIRCPDIIEALKLQNDGFETARLLKSWDDLLENHLPARFEDVEKRLKWKRWNAEEHSELHAAVRLIRKLMSSLTGSRAGAGSGAGRVAADRLTNALAIIYGDREFDPAAASTQEFPSVLSTLIDSADAVDRAALDLGPAETLELILEHASRRRMYARAEGPDEPVELQGWLELLWDEKPHLILAGMNEGVVPQSITGHAFLPESLRKELGLSTNEQRFARDVYLLSAMLASRRDGGRVELVLGRESSEGDPLKPSRLLFLCPGEELPERVELLFRSKEEAASQAPWHPAWKLNPQLPDESLSSISVTAFRQYLTCPFRFYLNIRLGMKEVKPSKTEMDAGEFGSLIHRALQAMAEDAAMRDESDEAVLREFLVDGLATQMRIQFGDTLSVPLQLQFESAAARLQAAARVQAEQRQQGWIIEESEVKIHDAVTDWQLGGLSIRGKIDRIDRHEEDGRYRVVDYKTSDHPAKPTDAHFKKVSGSSQDHLPAYAFFNIGGADYYWLDLQLPLYAVAVRHWKDVTPRWGYFNLPKSISKANLADEEWSDDIMNAAQRCAEGIIGDVVAGRFWPARERVPYDEFERLLFKRPQDTVEPEAITGGAEGGRG